MSTVRAAILSALLLAGGCAPGGGFQQLSGSILSQTGLVSQGQVDSIFTVGGKLTKAATPLTPEQEYYLGRGVAATVLSKYRPLRNPALQSYVNRVGSTVVAFSGQPETFAGYHFMVLDSTEINAMAAPGGFVFVTRGFLKLMPDEEALAAVLAHEVAHIALGHGTKAISQANLTEALTIVGREAASQALSDQGYGVAELTSVFGDSVTDVVDTLLTRGYSRSQEYDADEYATAVLRMAGYNTRGLSTMLTALETRAGSDQTGFFSTHPEPEDRLDELDEDGAAQSVVPGEAVRTARFKTAMRSLS